MQQMLVKSKPYIFILYSLKYGDAEPF